MNLTRSRIWAGQYDRGPSASRLHCPRVGISHMPEKETIERARRGRPKRPVPPSTQAGEFVREEIEHIREGKHGARSAKQAIAIGLSKARRAGSEVSSPKPGKASADARHAAKDSEEGMKGQHPPSPARSRATLRALQREGSAAASHQGLSRQAKASARTRTAADRSQAARKAVETKGPAELKAAARKAARTRSAAISRIRVEPIEPLPAACLTLPLTAES